MKKKETFIINIISQENSTWQGQITWLNERETKSFRSMLELIKMMNNAIETDQSAG